MRKLLSLVVLLVLSVTMLMAQTKIVTGRVVSSEDGEPIIGATVVVPGTQTGTVTDVDGHFSLRIPDNAKTVTVSYIGMEPQDVTVGKKGNISVTLSPSVEVFDEVIVTAYGTSTKGTFTGSATSIKADAIADIQVTNVSEVLKGTSGVQVQSANGQPGTESTIRVRGVGSINAGSSPLYVVDGIPYDGNLSAINTNDIETMTVLKDAASTSLYGARGANGIVLITTKSGKKGKAKINFDAKWGSNSREITNYNVLTSPKIYTEHMYEAIYNSVYYDLGYSAAAANAYANSKINTNSGGGSGYQVYTIPQGQSLVGMNGQLNPNATLGYSNGTYYYTPDNWADEMFTTTTHQSYDLSINGGNENGDYYIAVGYLQNDGIIEGSGFDRINTRFKGNYQAKSWLKVGANLAYSYAMQNYPGEQTSTSSSGNAFFAANYIAPIYPMYVRGTNQQILLNQGRRVYDYGTPSDAGNTRSFMSICNPMGDLIYNKTEYLRDILSAQGYWEVKPYKDLSIRGTYGLDVNNSKYNSLGNAYMGNDAAYGGTASQYHYRYFGFTQQYLAQYNHTFAEKHALDATLGYEGYTYKYEGIGGYGTELYDAESYYLYNTSDNQNIFGEGDNYATMGFFGRLNYSYDEKYILSASYRRDGSSRFSKDNRWGNFWSASAAWLLSQEKFMEGIDWIDMLKLKASYGEQGNDNIGNYYAYTDQYTISGSKGVWSDGTLSYKGNADITWETSKSWNAGFDFSMFGQKLNGTIEYWGRETADMLYMKPVAASNGYSEIPMNIGSMLNSGVEIDLTYDILHKKNYSLTVNANATYVMNEVKELHPDLNGELINGSYIYREGMSMYHRYLAHFEGVNPDDGQALYVAKNNGESAIQGLVATSYQDGCIASVETQSIEPGQEYLTSNITTANSTNKQISENCMPKWYGGFGLSGTFYGFDASINFSYQLGGHIYDSGYSNLMHNGYSYFTGYNWHKDIEGRWQKPGDITNVPRLDYSDTYGSGYYASDRWMTSASYLSLDNVSIGYTVPAKYTKKFFCDKIRFVFAGENLALWARRKGMDPRQSYWTTTTARYTAIRTLSGGISITF